MRSGDKTCDTTGKTPVDTRRVHFWNINQQEFLANICKNDNFNGTPVDLRPIMLE